MLIQRITIKLINILRFNLRPPYSLWLEAAAADNNADAVTAQAIYRHLVKNYRRSPESFKFAALSEQKLGNIETAIECLEQGLVKFPHDDELLDPYVRMCSESATIDRVISNPIIGQRPKAQILQFILDRKLTNDDVKVEWIKILFAADSHAAAEKYADEIIRDQVDVVVLWKLGDALLGFGQTARADVIYNGLSSRILSTSHDFFYAGLADYRLGSNYSCYQKLEQGLCQFPDDLDIKNLYVELCAISADYDQYEKFCRNCNFSKSQVLTDREFFLRAAKRVAPELFVIKNKDFERSLSTDRFEACKSECLSALRGKFTSFQQAKSVLTFARLLNMDSGFQKQLFEMCMEFAEERHSIREMRVLQLIYGLTPPIILQCKSNLQSVSRQFVDSANALVSTPLALCSPFADMDPFWIPWQNLFCLVEPDLYHEAMSAFENVAMSTWPGLNFTATHIGRGNSSHRDNSRKIRIGFFALDSMPMMSGLLQRLDEKIFETVHLRPGEPGASDTARDWALRADRTVEVSYLDAYAAIETIAAEELDILISGPHAPSVIYPSMARLASLQMVLLEPNWTDGFSNADYYISWSRAEPVNPGDFYKSAVIYTEHPPYWIEPPAVSSCSEFEKIEIRHRLIPGCENKHLYLCANSPSKIHWKMDPVLRQILERDKNAILVFLRADYLPTKSLKSRLRNHLGKLFERVVFLPTLPKRDAHLLLLAADCCLDSFPLCGMSSSFDGMMLGVPFVTLPHPIPFGRWTSAIYEYIEVTGLSAKDEDGYVDIAVKLATNKMWHEAKSEEIKRKSVRYMESVDSSVEFEQVILNAWRRKAEGLPLANWVSGNWG